MPALEVENVASVGAGGREPEQHGSENHPDTYSIPGVTSDPAPVPDQPSSTPAPTATPAAATPAQPREAGDTPAARAADAPGEAFIPKYRLDETQEARRRAETAVANQHAIIIEQREQLATMQAMVNRLMGGNGAVPAQAPAAQAPQLSEADQRIVDRFYALFPQFKSLERLVPHADELMRVTGEIVPAIQRNSEQHWERVGHHMYGQVDDGVAKLFLGEGKTGKDLDPAQQTRYRNDFYAWLRSEPRRQERYARLDSSLISDYVSELEHTYVAPVRARFGAGISQRAAGANNLPTQGGGAAPVATPPPSAKNPKDEDATHRNAWAEVQRQRQSV